MSEIGLILLLFIIGLELDLNKLLAAGKPVLMTGMLQFPLCVALGLAFFIPFGFRMSGGDFALLYLAVCLAISSTMIVVKLLYDKFELDTLPGRITLGVLIFQDIWAIVVLGIQPNLLNPQFGKLLGSLGSGVLLVGGDAGHQQDAAAAVVPVGRQAARAGADRIARMVLHRLRGGERRRTFAGDGRAHRRHQHLDVSVQPRRRGQGRQHPRFLRDAVLRRARHADSDADAASSSDWRCSRRAFLVASRFVVVFPILRALRQGHRASLLPAINLAQMSEFAMVIAAIGFGYQHIDQKTVSLLIFVFAITSVASTYLIGYSHPLQERSRDGCAGSASRISTKASRRRRRCGTLAGKDVVLLGFFTEASALVHEYEMGERRAHPMLDAAARHRLQSGRPCGARCAAASPAKYGDVASMQTLHHAEVHDAKLVVSTIPDTILKGTDNLRLLQQARRLCVRMRRWS